MWQLIVKKGMPPARKVRYCCDELKEGDGRGRVAVTGVRWEESSKRKLNRGMLESRKGNGKPYHQWQTGEDVMQWWLTEGRSFKVDENQLSIFEDDDSLYSS